MAHYSFYKITVNTLFFLSAIPFFAPFPLATDVQYPFYLTLLLLLILQLKRGLVLDTIDLMLLSMSIIGIFYINIFEDDKYQLYKALLPLIATLTFILVRNCFHLFSSKVYIAAVAFNFFAVVFLYTLPSLYLSTLGLGVRVIKVISFEGPRGISGLTSEPGFLGAISVYLILLGLYFYNRDRKKLIVVSVLLCLLMVLVTKSGTGYLYLIIISFFTILLYGKVSTKILLIVLSVIIIMLYTYYSGESMNRGGNVITSFLSNPYDYSPDKSITIRLDSIYLGLISLFEHPLGNGVGSYERVALHYQGAALSSVSAFSTLSVELGIIFILPLAIVFILGGKIVYSMLFKILALIFILASFSLAFPPIWVLLGAVYSHKYALPPRIILKL